MIEVNVISMLILLAAIQAASMLKRATMEATVVALMSLVKTNQYCNILDTN